MYTLYCICPMYVYDCIYRQCYVYTRYDCMCIYIYIEWANARVPPSPLFDPVWGVGIRSHFSEGEA